MIWQLKTKRLEFDHAPLVMGILNATPDSFSDGGTHYDPQHAINRGLEMVKAGTAILDIGGESTRPYSDPVGAEEELRRVLPVIQGLVAALPEVIVSIDTSKASVARAAIQAGAQIINDVTGLEGDPEMMAVAQESKAGVCVMHMQGGPKTMQDQPAYQDVVGDISDYLRQRFQSLIDAGISSERVCLDPGIGFGKTHEHNLTLLSSCEKFLELGRPILIGHSRKGFVGKLLNDKEAERDSGTLAISLMLSQKGMHVLRVHAAEATVRALRVQSGLEKRLARLV